VAAVVVFSMTVLKQVDQVVLAEDLVEDILVLQAEDQVINLPYLHLKDKMVEQVQDLMVLVLEAVVVEH
jgi:hypothetical protein